MVLVSRKAFALLSVCLLNLAVCAALGSSSLAETHSPSLYSQTTGLKFPNTAIEGLRPVLTSALVPKNMNSLSGFTELLPFVTPSPDQEEAGSCLYMSVTGIVEWWLHRMNNKSFVSDGALDLSERWWLNMASQGEGTEDIENSYTDTITMYSGQNAVLNRDYRFTKGWNVEIDDDVVPATPTTPNAVYDTSFNWIDETDKLKAPRIKLPKFTHEVVYAEPEEDPWAIGVAPENIVEKVKNALLKYKAPVQVVYNHTGYWHSVYVIGFDEEARIGECPFIKENLTEFQKEADLAAKEAEQAKTPEEKRKLLSRQKRYLAYKDELLESMRATKGCGQKGVFYVRDSQYSHPSEPIYRYDLADRRGDKPYSKRIILREFDWIRHMANHVSVIRLAPKP